MAVIVAPVVVLAMRHMHNQRATIRNFVIAAAAIALLCGAIAASSERLVNQCVAVGNTRCFDRGAGGMQAMFVGGYAIVAAIRSYSLWRG